MPVPDRSLEQRRVALARANVVRFAQAEVKRLVRGGYLGVDEVIGEPTEECRSMPIERLLLAAPGFGDVAVGRVLRDARVPASKTVGGLTAKQRRRLIDEVRLGPRVQHAPAHLSPPR